MSDCKHEPGINQVQALAELTFRIRAMLS